MVSVCLALAGLTAFSRAAAVEPFLRATDPQTGWLTSLRRAGDTNRVEFLRPGQALGAVTLRVRTPGVAVARSPAEHGWRGTDVPDSVRTATRCSGRSA